MGQVVCLDVGGTVIKNCVMDEMGTMYRRADRPVCAGGTREEILSTLSSTIQEQVDFVRRENGKLIGVGIAIGGPFDWENGISLIRNLGKYDSLYGVNLRDCLYERLRLPGRIPLRFDPDTWSFTRGELGSGAGKHERRGICFTIGTGLGSAFFHDGRIISEGPGVPWFGWIGGQKHREGILDNYICAGSMKRNFQRLTGQPLEVSEIARRAFAGEKPAVAVFRDLGAELSEFLRHHNLPEFKAECLIFGGQVSKSFALFAAPLLELKQEFGFLKKVVPAADIDNSSMKGLHSLFFKENARNAV